MTNANIIAGPAFWPASAVSTKMPVPMMAPMPSKVSWNAPSWRLSGFLSAVSKILSSGLTRWNSIPFSPMCCMGGACTPQVGDLKRSCPRDTSATGRGAG